MVDAQLDLLFGTTQPKKRRKLAPRSPNAAENNRRYREGLKARSEIALPASKRCCRCQITKVAAEFHRNKAEPDGLATRCKACKSEEHADRYSKSADRYDPSTSKTCSGCGKEKNATEFFRQTISRDGLSGYCRQCSAASTRANYLLNRETRIVAAWVNQKKNPEATRAARIATRNNERVAKAGSVGSFLAKEWLDLVGYFGHCCAYCLRHEDEVGLMTSDHLVPLSRSGTGYIENIVPSCMSCNGSKRDKTIIEFAAWIDRVQVLVA
jgi:5-methylcytosine-specific restriction endonuclease McrA